MGELDEHDGASEGSGSDLFPLFSSVTCGWLLMGGAGTSRAPGRFFWVAQEQLNGGR